MAFSIGADLGGTKLSVVLSGEDGRVFHELWVIHAITGVETLLAEFDRAIGECRSVAAGLGRAVVNFGLSIAAWMDVNRDRVLSAANLGLRLSGA
jgi:predicted NBD/HSP70 family sugar kinase